MARAEKRVEVSHPVIAIIDRYLPMITQLNEGYSLITNNQEQQRYIKAHYGFMADALVEEGPYTLNPEDVIAIWSRAVEVFSRYHRYALAGMVSSAYAVQGLDNSEWKKYSRHYLETRKLPETVIQDRESLLHVQGRLDELDRSLHDIDFYVYGVHESPMSLAFNLSKKASDGDEDAKRQLEELTARYEARSTPLLREIHENFGNGYTPLYFPIKEAL